MTKRYVLSILVAAVSLAGCMPKDTNLGNEVDGMFDTQKTTTWSSQDIDATLVPVLTWSEGVDTTTGVTQEVKDLIQERQTQNQDTSKLTEEDIDLMQKIIDKVKSIGN